MLEKKLLHYQPTEKRFLRTKVCICFNSNTKTILFVIVVYATDGLEEVLTSTGMGTVLRAVLRLALRRGSAVAGVLAAAIRLARLAQRGQSITGRGGGNGEWLTFVVWLV